MKSLNDLAHKMLQGALEAVDPFKLILSRCQVIHDHLQIDDLQIDLSSFHHIYVIGAGKASAPMARALEKLLGERIDDGLVIVKYGYKQYTQKIRIVEAGHPIPDQNTLKATQQLLKLVQNSQANDLIIFLLSGGGSALLEQLPQEIMLEDLQALNQLLLNCGANIEEINTVRKHVSLIKGGQLARQARPATLITLILSDVIGDPLSGIASGPTAPDDSTFADAWQVLEKYDLLDVLPLSVKEHLQKGLQGKIEETPKQDDPIFRRVKNRILGNNWLALKAAQKIAQNAGFNTLILTDRAQGEVSEISKLMAAVFESALIYQHLVPTPGCLLLGGEPTVKVKGQGKGGRNQELVLHLLQKLPGGHRFYFASIGTDGSDGPTDAAGAWIDHQTLDKVFNQKLNIQEYLDRNDSYHFFKKIDQLIKTGPTGTNVMDIMFFLF